MLKRKMKRIFAMLLAVILVLGSFSGPSVAHAADTDFPEVTGVSVSKTTITNANREVEVTVAGVNLPETLYYRLYQVDPDSGYDVKMVDNTAIAATGTAATKTFTVVIPENTSTKEEEWKVGVNHADVPNGWKKSEVITLAASGGSETPGGGDDTPEEPEAFSNKVLKVKVVDGSGQAIAGVKLYLESANFSGRGDVEFEEVTDANGKASYTCDEYDLLDDTYYLQPISGSGYTCEPLEIYVDYNDDDEMAVIEVDGEAYTSEITLTVEVEAPQVDKTNLQNAINKYVNKDAYTTASYQAYAEELAKAKKVNENTNATQAEVDAATKALNSAYNNLVFLALNVSADTEELPGTGGVVTVTATGTLNEKVWWKLQVKDENGYFVSAGEEVNETEVIDGKAVVEITIPENTTEEAMTYRINIQESNPDIGGGSYSWSFAQKIVVTVAVKETDTVWNAFDFTYAEGTDVKLQNIDGKSITVKPYNVTGLTELGKAKLESNPHMVIPEETPDGVKITGIGQAAFKGNTKIQSVTFPEGAMISFDGPEGMLAEGLTERGNFIIGYSAFDSCSNLTEVELSEGILSIESNAFKKCALTEVEIPHTVGWINSGAFAMNNTIASVIFAPEQDFKLFIGVQAFLQNNIKTVQLPKGVESVGKMTFAYNPGMEPISPDAPSTYKASMGYGVVYMYAEPEAASETQICHLENENKICWAQKLITDTETPDEVDKSKLAAAIETEDNSYKNEAAYTSASWDAYKAALTAAKEVNADETATQDQVDDAVKNLKAAVNGLTFLSLDKVSVTPNSLTSDGGTVTVKAEGTLNAKVWWKLEKLNADGSTEVVGEDINEATLGEDGTFSVSVPANEAETEVTYRVVVKESEPSPWSWGTTKKVTITVEAMEKPEPANKEDLNYQIDFSKKFEGKEAEYTAESYQAFKAALAEAKTVAADETATQEAVDAAKDALKAAREALEELPLCKETEIRILIVNEDGQKVTESIPIRINTSKQNVTTGLISYDLSTADLGTSEIVVAFNADSITIGEKEYVLSPASYTFTLKEYAGDVTVSAIDGKPLTGPTALQFVLTEKQADVVDKDALTAKIAEMKAVTSEGYTTESYAALQTAISEAEAVEAKADATQEEVDAAVKALDDAYAALKSDAVDKSKLAAAIEKEENTYRNEAAYTTVSLNAYKAALAAAKEVNADETATQAQVDDAVKNLKAAVAGLTYLSLDKVTVTPDSLTSDGGTVTVKAEGTLNAKVWWKLEKLNADGSTEVVGEDINEATLGEDGTFSVSVPANEAETEVTYRVVVKESEPSPWYWGTTKKATINVAGKPVVTAEIKSVTANVQAVPYANGKVEITVTGTGLEAENLGVSVSPIAKLGQITGTDTELKFTVEFFANTGISPKEYTISVNLEGQDAEETVVTVSGVNTITGAEALKHPEYILDVRDEETILSTGSIPGSQFCPQFPMDDKTLDEKMQEFAARYKDSSEPIYILCKSGLMGAPRATQNLLVAGIAPSRIVTILNGANDTNIKAAMEAAKTGWKQDSIGWWYKNEDGSYPSACWKQIDGAWYYFNASGYRVTGWQAINGAWYYFDNEGVMASAEWVDGDKYYMTAGGAMATGWLHLDEGWYYLGTNGVVQTGWILVGGVWYYANPESETPGLLLEKAWMESGAVKYYFNAGGSMAKGWTLIGGEYYYFTSGGAMASNTWAGSYYLGAEGKMVTNDWVGVYHVDAKGVYQTGWLKLDEGWYYLGTSGAVQTGWILVGGTWYYGDPNSEAPGLLLEKTWMESGTVKYYFNAGGSMAKGWTLIGGEYYYFTSGGAMVTNTWVGNYYLKADGTMARNEWVDNEKYFVDANGLWVPNP